MDVQPLARAELVLPVDADSASLARSFTRDILAKRNYRGARDDAVLVVSELVTNALLHGAGVRMLRLMVTAWRVRIEVTDGSPVTPEMREPGSDGGWGLRVIEQLSVSWGVTPSESGKLVWCELEARLRPVIPHSEETVA